MKAGMGFGQRKYPITHGVTKAQVDRDETEETELTAKQMLESGLNDSESLDEGFPRKSEGNLRYIASDT